MPTATDDVLLNQVHSRSGCIHDFNKGAFVTRTALLLDYSKAAHQSDALHQSANGETLILSATE
jgi:hypothetical protein